MSRCGDCFTFPCECGVNLDTNLDTEFDTKIDAIALGNDIVADIRFHARNSKRSLQKALGPSDISKPCERAIGYKLLGSESVNDPDPWFTIIGSAMHKWMEECYRAKNKRLGYARYLIEHKVSVGGKISGKLDIFDTELNAVIDWKFVGESGLKRGKSGEDESYSQQLSLYAKAISKKYPVDWIITVYLPRNNFLSKRFVNVAAYEPALADKALERYLKVAKVVAKGGADSLALLIPTTHHCDFCPFFLPGSLDISLGCPGASSTTSNN